MPMGSGFVGCIRNLTFTADGTNFLVVGHAATLDTCARALTGGKRRSWLGMINFVSKVRVNHTLTTPYF